jgi:hypothetical protein
MLRKLITAMQQENSVLQGKIQWCKQQKEKLKMRTTHENASMDPSMVVSRN